MTYSMHRQLLGWGGGDEFAIYLTYHTIVHRKEWVWMGIVLNYKYTKSLILCMCLLLFLKINNLQLFADFMLELSHYLNGNNRQGESVDILLKYVVQSNGGNESKVHVGAYQCR